MARKRGAEFRPVTKREARQAATQRGASGRIQVHHVAGVAESRAAGVGDTIIRAPMNSIGLTKGEHVKAGRQDSGAAVSVLLGFWNFLNS